MKRNFSGSILALLLLAVIAMKQVALGFCLCETSYFFESCECHESGCDLGPCHQSHDEETPEAPAPCDDCEITFSLDTGAYFWSSPSEPHQDVESEDLTPQLAHDLHLPSFSVLVREHTSPRGSPPTARALYLRHQSFRL